MFITMELILNKTSLMSINLTLGNLLTTVYDNMYYDNVRLQFEFNITGVRYFPLSSDACNAEANFPVISIKYSTLNKFKYQPILPIPRCVGRGVEAYVILILTCKWSELQYYVKCRLLS